MLWEPIRGWFDNNMEPSFSLVSISVNLVTMFAYYSYSSAPLSATVGVAIYILPEELTSEWDKQPLGDQMVIDVASILESRDTWQCKSHLNISDTIIDRALGNVPGLSAGPATLSIICKANDTLVSSM